MLQKAAAFILLLAFSAISFQNAGLVLSYRVNKAAYMEKCVNKDRPELRCNGQCLLMKKMQEQEHQEQDHPDSKPGAQSTLFHGQEHTTQISQPETGLNLVYPPGITPLLTNRPSDIFHPPRG
ncbi:MAG: hypothetical protein J0M10_08390 [Chitinophagales bacterium]|nr:hypothetical protein [Chitinophagales bacterium]